MEVGGGRGGGRPCPDRTVLVPFPGGPPKPAPTAGPSKTGVGLQRWRPGVGGPRVTGPPLLRLGGREGRGEPAPSLSAPGLLLWSQPPLPPRGHCPACLCGLVSTFTLTSSAKPCFQIRSRVGRVTLGRRCRAGQTPGSDPACPRVRTFPRDSPLGRDTVRALMHYALKVWSDITPLNFHEVAGSAADIQIDFSKADHNDAYPFDGPGGAVAHAFLPGDQLSAGDAHFDDDESWAFRSPGAWG